METCKHTHAVDLTRDLVDLTKPFLHQEAVYRKMRNIAKQNDISLHRLVNIAKAQLAGSHPFDETQPKGAWLVITFDLPVRHARAS